MIMNESQSASMDPICGMTVDAASSLHVERDGETFYFCSDQCRKKFLSAPTDDKPEANSEDCCSG